MTVDQYITRPGHSKEMTAVRDGFFCAVFFFEWMEIPRFQSIFFMGFLVPLV